MENKTKKIGFKLSAAQKAEVMLALDFCEDFCSLNWEAAFLKLFPTAFVDYDENTVFGSNWKQLLDEVRYKITGPFPDLKDVFNPDEVTLKRIKEKFEKVLDQDIMILEFTPEEANVFSKALDFPYRVASGQWDMFGTWLYNLKDKDGKAIIESYFVDIPNGAEYRNAIIRPFGDKEVPYNASFGIMSHMFTEKARILYDVYKAFMYEECGIGVHGYKPNKAEQTDDPMPRVETEITFLFECTEELLKPETTDALMFREFSELARPLKKFDGYEGELFVPVSEKIGTLYNPLKIGDKVYLKKNGFYVIQSKGDPEPTIEYRLLFKQD